MDFEASANESKRIEKNALNLVQDQIRAFNIYHGEHSGLDSLLSNLQIIVDKYKQETGVGDNLMQIQQQQLSPENEELGIDSEVDPSTLTWTVGGTDIDTSKRKLSVVSSTLESNCSANDTSKRIKLREKSYHRDGANETDNEEEVATVTKHPVFTTELVMLNILQRLDFAQLKLCREINTNFRHYAEQVIHERRCITVRFTYNWTEHAYVTKAQKNEPYLAGTYSIGKTLSTFTKFVKSRPNFPSQDFEFYSGNLRSDDLQEFLSTHGTNIKRLSLDVFRLPQYANEAIESTYSNSKYPTISFLKNVLVNQLPLLQSLTLSYCPKRWNAGLCLDRLFPEPKERQITLPNLQELRTGKSVPEWIFNDLLRSCSNLKVVMLLTLSLTKLVSLIKMEKFYLLNQLAFEPQQNDHDIGYYEMIHPNTRSTLQYFIFKPLSQQLNLNLLPRLTNIYSNILQSSSASLQHIGFHTSIGFLHDLQIPVLPKVRGIQICVGNNGSSFLESINAGQFLTKRQFPEEFQFVNSFPNLNAVKIYVYTLEMSKDWFNYFDNYTPVLTVRELCIKEKQLPSVWFENFSNIFPNVETLDVKTKHLNIFEAGQKGLWSFYQVKHLSLEIDLVDEFNSFPRLDSAFTGFSMEACNELLKSSHNFDISRVDDLREFPSIVDLKNLETLDLIFVDLSEEFDVIYEPFLTFVTGLFAFQMCPRLKVTLSGKLANCISSAGLRNAMSGLEEYVHIRFPFDVVTFS